MPLPDSIRDVLAVFRPLCTAPTWRKRMLVWTGTRVAHGRCTVTAALRRSGHERETTVSTFHQAFKRARWSPLAMSRQVLTVMVETFVLAGWNW